jgi:hypothetical protein
MKKTRSQSAKIDTVALFTLFVLTFGGSGSFLTYHLTKTSVDKEIAKIVALKTAEFDAERERLKLDIRAAQSQVEERELRLSILENEYIFDGIPGETYDEKDRWIQETYIKKRAAVQKARTMPSLIAQINELRPQYQKSEWQKKKIPDLPSSENLANLFYDVGLETNINPTVLVAVTWTESRFRPDICHGLKHSEAGAVGCMQIMPFHVDRFDFITDTKKLATDLETNVRAGAHILREYLDHKFAVQAGNQLEAALRLYNYGPTNYNHRIRKNRGFNKYAETVIEKAETLFDEFTPVREKFGPENDPARYLLDPLANNEVGLIIAREEVMW